MIIRIVKLTLDPQKLEMFCEVFDNVKKQILAFEGCQYNELLKEQSESGVVFTYSHWNSAAELDNYRNSELFKDSWAKVKPMFAAKAEAWTLDKHVDK